MSDLQQFSKLFVEIYQVFKSSQQKADLQEIKQKKLSGGGHVITGNGYFTNDKSSLQPRIGTLGGQYFYGGVHALASSADQTHYLGADSGQRLPQVERGKQQLIARSNQGCHDNQRQIGWQERYQHQLGCQDQPQPLYSNLPNDETYLQYRNVPLHQQPFDSSRHGRGSSVDQIQELDNADDINSTTTSSWYNYPTSNQPSSYDNQLSHISDPYSGTSTSSEYPDFSVPTEGLNDIWNTTMQPASQPINRQIRRNSATRMSQFDAMSANQPLSRPGTLPDHLSSLHHICLQISSTDV